MSLLTSVIIPTYQRPGDLARCLDQLAPEAQTLPFDQYEVIVTDDEGEGSATEHLVKEHYPWARWVPAPGRGPAANRNNGARYASGEWLVFTDDDCIPQPRWLGAYADAIRETSCNILEGPTHAEGPRESLAWYAPINTEGGRLWSCNFSARSDVFHQLDGFDESYPFALEDMDFKTRVSEAGFSTVFVKKAAVVHPWRVQSPSAIFQRQLRELRGWYRFAQKHPDKIQRFKAGYLLRPLFTAFNDVCNHFRTHKGCGLLSYLAFLIGGIIKAVGVVAFSTSSRTQKTKK